MGVMSKHSETDIKKAVERYAQGEPVRALAKQYKVSVPAVYLWIKRAKEEMADKARKSGMRPETRKLEEDINLDLLVKEQAAQIEGLKRKLFELMVETGKL